ncbi:MAG: VWA domain-containing protein [Planctomycetota bacterium]
MNRNHAQRTGLAMLLLLFWLSIALLLAGILLDGRLLQLRQQHLATLADAAAVAGASQLASGPTAVCATIAEFLEKNARLGLSSSFVGVAADTYEMEVTVEFGDWDPPTESWQSSTQLPATWRMSVTRDGSPSAAGMVPTAPGASTSSAAATIGNAVRVIVKRNVPLLLGGLIQRRSTLLTAQATAAQQPREIVFVIDRSGSMNNDTEPWSRSALDACYGNPSAPTPGSQCLSQLIDDAGWSTNWLNLRHLDAGLAGAPGNDFSYRWLTQTYLVQNANLSTFYRVSAADSVLVRKTKAYRWLIDYQIPLAMPAVSPPATSADESSFAYWSAYLDYVIKPLAGLPPAQATLRLGTANNPDLAQWPDLTPAVIQGSYNKIGYQTYLQFLLDLGPDLASGETLYSPLSTRSSACRWRLDRDPASAGNGVWFPSREQPMHAVRLALLATLRQLQRTQAMRPPGAQDHVGLVTFSTLEDSRVVVPLGTGQGDDAPLVRGIAALQAAGDAQTNSNMEAGLLLARQQLTDPNVSGPARSWTDKVVVLLADGPPNGKVSTASQIDEYVAAHPSSQWYSTGDYRYERQAVLMQVAAMRELGWRVLAVGIGRAVDQPLLDRVARLGNTAEQIVADPAAPRGAISVGGNPSEYEARLTAELQRVLARPRVKLVRCLSG